MAKQPEWYYVLVFTNSGPKYVTDIGDGHMAYWEEDKKPMSFTKSHATDIVYGLSMNLYQSILATSLYELNSQPYSYDKYKIDWVEKETEEE